MSKPRIEIPDLVEDMATVEEIRLPMLKVYQTEDGEYFYPSRRIIERAIKETLANKSNTHSNGEPIALLVVVQVLPMSQRKRRQRQGVKNE